MLDAALSERVNWPTVGTMAMAMAMVTSWLQDDQGSQPAWMQSTPAAARCSNVCLPGGGAACPMAWRQDGLTLFWPLLPRTQRSPCASPAKGLAVGHSLRRSTRAT
jgi:hypothetical protein